MRKFVSNMNSEFNSAWFQATCQWIDFIGQPMLYDGCLFVTREEF